MRTIDPIEILETIEDYVLIKKDPDFPKYSEGSDIDLLVLDSATAVKSISEVFNSRLSLVFDLRVTGEHEHIHLDFLRGKQIHLRFDMLKSFNFFQNFSVRGNYFTKVFRDRRRISVSDGRKIFVPLEEDELTLRYFEYLEWFGRVPEKIKHAEYIATVTDPELRQKFFDNTHRFIAFTPKTWPPTEKYFSAINNRIIPEPKSRKEALRLIIHNFRFLIAQTLRIVAEKTFGAAPRSSLVD